MFLEINCIYKDGYSKQITIAVSSIVNVQHADLVNKANFPHCAAVIEMQDKGILLVTNEYEEIVRLLPDVQKVPDPQMVTACAISMDEDERDEETVLRPAPPPYGLRGSRW